MAIYRFPTELGACALGYEDDRITAFHLPEAVPAPAADASTAAAPAWVEAIASRICAHLAGQPQDFADVPYAWSRVSSFQQQVYRAALQVKAGHTSTYGSLATALGQPVAASRAVGVALGQNPWPLLVPCHRFIGANGKMVGFSGPGGIRTKLALLAREGAQLLAEESVTTPSVAHCQPRHVPR